MENNKEEKQSPYKEFEAFLTRFAAGKTYINRDEKTIDKEKMQMIYTTFANHSQKGNDDRKFDEVIEDLRKDKNNSSQEAFDIINHAIWLWCLPNNRKANWAFYNVEEKGKGKKEKNKNDNSNKGLYKDELLKIKGVAGGGSGYVQTKTNGVRFVLFLFTQILNLAKLDYLKKIEAVCKKDKYDDKYDVPDGVKNLLLHLCEPQKYEPIAASADKKKIIKAFENIVTLTGTDDDAKIKEIREYLNGSKMLAQDASFYANSLLLIWKGESTTDLSLAQKLEYKKAMILYGPPGTGKTYAAMELAKEMIVRHFMNKYKDAKCSGDRARQEAEKAAKEAKKAKKEEKEKEAVEAKSKAIQANMLKNEALVFCFNLLKNIEEEKKKYISYLQFHINYNYEDFIAGQVIKGNSVDTKKGVIFDIIKKAELNSNVPYVVILDEINRTDISRVFGELFTAIEKRGQAVTLTLPKPKKESKGKDEERLELNLPNNIYFIGTMNEIDFSLERVDFALRRRFIWELLDYSEDSLENIIENRLQKYVTDKKLDAKSANDFYKNVDIDSYCNACTSLNKKVSELMDDTYHIGHAFFAELADIYIELRKNNTTGNAWKQAKKILWEISIKPTLEAYCGTMDKTEKEKYLKGQGSTFYDAFFGKEKPENEEEPQNADQHEGGSNHATEA